MKSPLIKYSLFQVPGTVLVGAIGAGVCEYYELSLAYSAAAMGVKLLKDVVVYPWVKNAYAETESSTTISMIDRVVTVRQTIAPVGYVDLDDELWRAQSRDSDERFEEGDEVRIVEVDGLTVVVERMGDLSAEPS